MSLSVCKDSEIFPTNQIFGKKVKKKIDLGQETNSRTPFLLFIFL